MTCTLPFHLARSVTPLLRAGMLPGARRFVCIALAVVLGGIALPCRAGSGAGEEGYITARTSSPRATIASFRGACDEIHKLIREEERGTIRRDEQRHQRIVGRILACLDLSHEPEFLRIERGRQAAVCLKEILDRIPIPPDEEIPGAVDVEPDGDDSGLKQWRIPRTNITIKRIDEGERQGDYLFSAGTVKRAAPYYERIRSLPYQAGAIGGFYEWFQAAPGPRVARLISWLPDWMRTTMWGQHAIWQWLGLVVSLVLGASVTIAIYVFGRRYARRERKLGLLGYSLTLVFPVVAMFIPLLLSDFVRDELRFSGGVLATISFTANIIFLIGLMIVIVGTGSRIAEVLVAGPGTRGLDAQLTRVVCRIIALGAATLVFLEGGRYLGIPLSTLLASAGVGGFALALAAQDSLKNFFGSMMIFLDKPFRVGERIMVGDFDGIVEEIGLRSTKIRLLTGHQATIPNEEMARTHIENIGRRPHIRRLADLRLPLDTPSDKAREAVAIVEGILADHQGMEPGLEPKAYLTDICPDALNLRMVYWFHPPDYWQFLAFGQKVNLEIKQSFEHAGIDFALPTTTTHVKVEGDKML